MADAIKAIETCYKGYRFRSRLEARWAIFFDEACVPWEYEPEGFEVHGTWYLPDFWMPSFSSYLEIKPDFFSLDDGALIKPLCLAEERRVVVLCGNPWPREYIAIRMSKLRGEFFPTARFARCSKCLEVDLCFVSQNESWIFGPRILKGNRNADCEHKFSSRDLESAYSASRTFRW